MRKATYLLLLIIGLASCLADVQAGGAVAEELLFDQFASPLAIGILSEQFADVDNLHFIAADDFVVPDGQNWKVERVAIRGIFQTDKDPSEENGAIWTIRIYPSVPGKLTETQPATSPLFEETALTASANDAAGSDTFGNINFTLTNPPILAPGHYWLSVFPTKSGRAFFWEVTDMGNLDPFLINQDVGLDVCSDISAVEASKWTLPFRCPQAFFFEDNSTADTVDINTLNALVFRLEGPITQATTTGNAAQTTGAVVTTAGTGVVVTTGQSGGVVITTAGTGVQITTEGIVVTGDGNVGSVNLSSSANTLSSFLNWFF